MTRRTVGTRRKFALTAAAASALLLGGVVMAPFASAAESTGDQGGARRSGAVDRWLSFWTGGGTRPGTGAQPGTGARPGGGTGAQPGGTATQPAAGACADVELVFARGTGDFPQPLGILGVPLSSALRQKLPGRTVTAYGVNYAADFAQTSDGPGATDMSRHVVEVAARCPRTRFVIGGYSQGASVTDIAIAARGADVLGRGETIPTTLAPRIAAVVVFGNPLSGFGGGTIETASALYGPKARSFCGTADTICGGARNGNVQGGHLSYRTNGAVDQAATFAAGKVTGS